MTLRTALRALRALPLSEWVGLPVLFALFYALAGWPLVLP
jgi:hypothetical protein